MKRRIVLAAALLAAAGPALAQSSVDYELREHVLNAGGRPAQAVIATSASFRVRLDSIGGPLVGHAASGNSFRLVAGFASTYGPPGEVMGLEFLADGQTLHWLSQPASTAYNVYTGLLSSLPGSYGGCAEPRVTQTSWIDPAMSSPGDARFYLVTAENRLWEEGTKGFAASGAERGNPAACP